MFVSKRLSIQRCSSSVGQKSAAALLEKIEAAGVRLTAVDALRLAEEAGSQKAVNVVLIGAMASSLDIPEESWLSAIEKTVPAKFLDMNKRAFALGYRA